MRNAMWMTLVILFLSHFMVACSPTVSEEDDDQEPTYTCEDFCQKVVDCSPSCLDGDCMEFCQGEASANQKACTAQATCDAFNDCLCGDDDDDASDDDSSGDGDDSPGDDDATDDDATDDDDSIDDDDDNDTISEGFLRIENGSFFMGSPVSEPGRDNDEEKHYVTLTQAFEMNQFEVTQGVFTTQMEWNPSCFGPNGDNEECGDDCPVECVSWFDAVAYANEKSEQAGYDTCYLLSDGVCEDGSEVGENYMDCMDTTAGGIDAATVSLNNLETIYECEGYRLPTESEWEYAARAGTTSAYHNGFDSDAGHLDCQLPFHLTDIAWYCGNNEEMPQVVGEKAANNWGFHDMSGNVREWTWDWYGVYPGAVIDPEGPDDGLFHVSRGGGSWRYEARLCRSANRAYMADQGYRSKHQGFRLARTLP